VEVSSGHIVPLLAVSGEILDGRKKMAQEVDRRFAGMTAANILDAFHAKLLVQYVAGVAEAVREKEERIAGFQL
jgi:hypothetical protein